VGVSAKQLLLLAFDLPNADELLPWLGLRLEEELGMHPLHGVPAPDVSGCFVQGRRQYDAHRVLSVLSESARADFVLAVTSADLFLPVFTFVLGEAELGGKAAVVSTFRLDEERYGLPADNERLYARLVKEAIHELGHCLGLTHCVSSNCVMFTSSGVEEVDLKGERFCGRCQARLGRVPARAPV
jgi:archaemetzincin